MSRKPRHELFDLGPLKDAQYKFMRQLESARDSIKKEAKGKVCGNCKFYNYECCSANISAVTGNDLECNSESVACRKYIQRK